MKIVFQGNKDKRIDVNDSFRFLCEHCECEFIARRIETSPCDWISLFGAETRYTYCPNCKHTVNSDERCESECLV